MAAHTLAVTLTLLLTVTLTQVSRCHSKDLLGLLKNMQSENSVHKMQQSNIETTTPAMGQWWDNPASDSRNNLWPFRNTKQPETQHTTKQPSLLQRDCQDWWDAGYTEPGVFTIYPSGSDGIQVWCEHTLYNTATIIQRRQFGNVSFVRPLNEYQTHFGDPAGDYWAGLAHINQMTYLGNMKLSIALQDWYGNTQYMVYNTFIVGDHTTKYQLTIGQAQGNLADDLAFSNGMPFSTYDYPDLRSCASTQLAGWWYNYCAYALLNGKYYYGGMYHPPAGMYDGIYWKDWYGYDYSLKFVSMALVRKY